MTLKQIATSVRNNVVDGLKGVDVTSFSIEQLEDEILLATPALLVQFASNGLINMAAINQRIDGVEIECKDLSSNCAVDSETCAPHFEIPTLNLSAATPITYLGTMDGAFTFKVYTDRDYRFHKYRLATAKSPYAWVSTTSNADGFFDVYLFNMGKYENLKFISITALFDNPYDLLSTDYYAQFSSSEYYAPYIIQSALIDSMTQKYIKYYRQLQQAPRPNTQE